MGIAERLTGRIIAMIVGGLILLALIVFGVSQCQKNKSLGTQAKVDKAQTGALANSAADAIGTTQDVAANAAASEDLTRSNEKDIRNAEGADTRVGAAVDAAGRRSLCKRAAYRNDPKCRVFNAPAR